MVNKVIKTVESHRMFCSGDRVIVALSGGADSTVLLHILLEISQKLGITVEAAHVNHKLRGEESDRDQHFAEELCKSLGVRLFVKSVDVNSICKETKESFELAGRRVRYEFFESLCDDENVKIATAHTLSDSAETALFNIARGTSLSGLCSIPYVRGKIVRPLLDVTRKEIEDYAGLNKLRFVTDSTNTDADICSRNRIRHGAVPVLKEVNPAFEQNFMKLRSQLLQVDEYMSSLAKEVLIKAKTEYGYKADVILKEEDALSGYVICALLEEKGASAEQRHISLIKGILKSGGAVNLSDGFTVVCRQGILRICKDTEEFFSELPFELNKKITFGNKQISTEEITPKSIVNKKLAFSCIACDKLSRNTVFRTRRTGDRFAPLNRGITKDLRKLQNELKIPAELRDSALVLADGSCVLWAEGIGASEDGVYKGKGKCVLVEVKSL